MEVRVSVKNIGIGSKMRMLAKSMMNNQYSQYLLRIIENRP